MRINSLSIDFRALRQHFITYL